jgi:hypothetical protein
MQTKGRTSNTTLYNKQRTKLAEHKPEPMPPQSLDDQEGRKGSGSYLKE